MPQEISEQTLQHWPVSAIEELHLEMGKQCNVRCAMCYQTDFSPSSKMPDRIWKDRLAPVYPTARTLTLSGGEPTVLSNCRALIELVLRNHAHLHLNTVTNGILFKGFWEEAFLQQGAFLNFSLNAIEPELYRKLVQFGKQEAVIANIDRIVKRKQETGSKLILRISAVILDETIHELPAFVQWGVDHGLDQVLFFTDHFGNIRRTEPKSVQRFIAEAYAVADRNPQIKLILLDDFDWYHASMHGIPPVRPRPAIAHNKAKLCPIPFNTLFVNPDGTVKPCCKSWYVFGDLTHSTLEDVWNSRSAYRFRKRMLKLDFRDCLVVCDLNARPINPHVAQIRKACWVVRRDPKSALKKGLRKFGLTSAQMKSKR